MYGFIRKIEPFHLRMKHNIIDMTATAGLTVPHSINPIFQFIFDCSGFNACCCIQRKGRNTLLVLVLDMCP